jgi:hypothetical protein
VAILREDEANSGMDEMIARAEEVYNIPKDKMEAIITPSFEKARELARMIV